MNFRTIFAWTRGHKIVDTFTLHSDVTSAKNLKLRQPMTVNNTHAYRGRRVHKDTFSRRKFTTNAEEKRGVSPKPELVKTLQKNADQLATSGFQGFKFRRIERCFIQSDQ